MMRRRSSSSNSPVEARERASAAGPSMAMLWAQSETKLIPKGYSVDDADWFVDYSIHDLCPDANGSGDSSGGGAGTLA